MLHFPVLFFIHVPLGFLMATIVGSTGWGVVRLCVGLKILISINTLSDLPPQKEPLAQMSRGAPLSVDVDLHWKGSPVISWRAGSTATSKQISVRREARRSLTSLWHAVGNPLLGQSRAWSVLKGLPQTQCGGSLSRAHPYLSANVSLRFRLHEDIFMRTRFRTLLSTRRFTCLHGNSPLVCMVTPEVSVCLTKSKMAMWGYRLDVTPLTFAFKLICYHYCGFLTCWSNVRHRRTPDSPQEYYLNLS